MLAQATITSKGQTTIPKEIRDSLGLQPQDKLNFTLLSDGTVIMRAKKRAFDSLFGALAQDNQAIIDIDQMQIE